MIGVGLFHSFLPGSEGLWISSRLARHVHEIDPQGTARVGMVGYREDSLRFLLGDRVEPVAPESARSWLELTPGGILLVSEEIDAAYLVEHAEVTGFNYSSGDRVRVRVLISGDSGS